MPDQVFCSYRRVDAYVWYEFGVKDFFNYLPADAVDWHYKDTNPVIRNLAGEDMKRKDAAIIKDVPSLPTPVPKQQSWIKRLFKWV